MSDQTQENPTDPEEELLERMLRDNPLFRKTAEAIARDHGMTLLEAAKDLREFW